MSGVRCRCLYRRERLPTGAGNLSPQGQVSVAWPSPQKLRLSLELAKLLVGFDDSGRPRANPTWAGMATAHVNPPQTFRLPIPLGQTGHASRAGLTTLATLKFGPLGKPAHIHGPMDGLGDSGEHRGRTRALHSAKSSPRGRLVLYYLSSGVFFPVLTRRRLVFE